MGFNLDFFIISLLFSLLSTEHTYDFFSNESLLDEDSSTLNIGESSSQGSSGQNPNSGQGSSQGPSGQNPNNGGNPSPHNGAPDPMTPMSSLIHPLIQAIPVLQLFVIQID
jgi:hypothetical protein